MKFSSAVFLFTLFITRALFAQPTTVEKIDNNLIKANQTLDSKSDSALFYAASAYQLADSLHMYDKKVDALFLMARAYIVIGQGVKAYEMIVEARELIDAYGLNEKEPTAYMYLGLVYQKTGLTAEAVKNFFIADELFNQSINQVNVKDIVDLYYHISLSYFRMGETKLSNEYAKKSIQIATEKSSQVKALKSYLLLAENQNSIDSIKYYYALTDQILTKYDASSYTQVVLLNNQALLHKALGKYKESKAYYQKAIAIAIQNGFKAFLSEVYNNYAYLMMAENKYDSTRVYLDKAMDIALEINDLGLEGSIYDSYSDYYKATGDYRQAYENYTMAATKKAELAEKKQLQVSLFLSTVYETEKKEKEILLKENQISQFRSILFGTIAIITVLLAFLIYYRQKTLLGRARLETIEKEKSLEIADALIEGQDVERKRLAMDLHDGLGARLGSLRFMIDAFVKGNPNFDEISNAVTGISKHVRDLSHRMLPTQLEELGLIASLQNLVNSMNQTSGFTVEMESQVEERLSPRHETNLYYLTYELINNAVKHSGGNSIFIQLFGHTDSVTLSVEDNGNGFDTSISKDGLGLKNIKQRVEYLKGELIVDSRIDEGTIFMIEVPIF